MPTATRSTTGRSWTASSTPMSRPGNIAADPGRLHARGAVRRPRPLPAQLVARGPLHDDHDRLGRAAQRPREMGRPRRRLGAPPGRSLRRGQGRRPGRGKSGTSPTATTGPARSPSSARCTTRRRRRSSARSPAPASAARTPAAPSPTTKAQTFLRGFLQHVVDTGSPIDFIAFHAKGNPVVHDGHVRMGLHKQLRDIETNLAIINEFPELKGTAGGDRRVRSRGLRRLLGARASAERLPQRPALRRLCRREHAAHLRAVAAAPASRSRAP